MLAQYSSINGIHYSTLPSGRARSVSERARSVIGMRHFALAYSYIGDKFISSSYINNNKNFSGYTNSSIGFSVKRYRRP